MDEFVKKQVEAAFVNYNTLISKLQSKSNVIKIFGIGGAGQNILKSIMAQIQDTIFISAETDFKSLAISSASIKIQLGEKTTSGLGASSNPEKGREAAEESLKEIESSILGADIIILVAGMGGGTGTGATQIIADIARTLGVFTIGLVTLPFTYEGNARNEQAKSGIRGLEKSVNALIAIPNDQLCVLENPNKSLFDSFKDGDAILIDVIRWIIGRCTNVQTK